jgi:RNA polymerase sigma-70 factor (ECF subfamily)
MSDDFATTRWSMVLRAARRQDRNAEDALAMLCQQYWYPLYAYVRRRVADPNEAQDLIQGFFVRLLEKNILGHADQERGRFRAFLLASLKNFLTNEWNLAAAQKRGGQAVRWSLDLSSGESRVDLEPCDNVTPERHYERAWALTLLNLVTSRLENEYTTTGKQRHFELLKNTLTGARGGLPLAEIGAELGLSEEAVRQAAQRLRKRYRQLLREEVAHTVAESGDVEDEIRRLFETFARD